MLKQLKLANFTVFHDVTFQFSEKLNIIHGINGTGKTHVLKLAYVLQHALANPPLTAAGIGPTKVALQRAFAEELVEVFRPEALGRLATRTPKGRKTVEVSARFKQSGQRALFTFHTASKTEVKLDRIPTIWLRKQPVFLPTREALTIYPGFVSLFDTTAIEFDRTWRDLCLLLGAPLSRGVKAANVRQLLEPLEEVMGGRIELDTSGKFYLKDDRGRIEMHLVAEGLRKLAMVARLIATGGLEEKGCLLWDEPDANLNPRLVKKVATVLVSLAKQGVQVFIATHSLFLMRELHILLRQQTGDVNARYFGLHLTEEDVVEVLQGDDIGESGDVAALDEDLEQSDRYIDQETGARS